MTSLSAHDLAEVRGPRRNYTLWLMRLGFVAANVGLWALLIIGARRLMGLG